MNADMMAALSLLLAVGSLVVLVGFVRHLTQVLTRTGDNLVGAVGITATIRQDCEEIVGGVLALNRNLDTAAGGLMAVVDSARQRRLALTRTPEPVRTPTPAPAPVPAHVAAPARTSIREPAPAAAPAEPARTSIRQPAPAEPPRPPVRTTVREPLPAVDVAQEFRRRMQG